MPLEDFIIYVYCCVVDIYPKLSIHHSGAEDLIPS